MNFLEKFEKPKSSQSNSDNSYGLNSDNTYGIEDEILRSGIDIFNDNSNNAFVQIERVEPELTRTLSTPSKLFGFFKSLDLDNDGKFYFNFCYLMLLKDS
jgi:hypothetical protein